MSLSSRLFKDYQSSRKEAKSSSASPEARVTATGNTPAGTEKAQSTAAPVAPPSPKLLKDTREYERERQRLRKTADFVKMRARKAKQGAGLGSDKAHDHNDSRKGFGAAMPSEKGKQLRGEDIDEDDVEGPVPSENCPKGVDWGTGMVHIEPRYEVKLADLVQTGRPRKPKGDADFEVIPHIRSVIVLDDNTPDELDIDEPWEHVYNSDCEDSKGLSYAQVVALSK